MTKPPSVGIVVPCWNRIDDTLELLDSFDALTYPDLHFVFVDNASTDGTADRLRARHPHSTVLQNDRNRGFAAAVNQGIQCAMQRGCAYALLINSDTTVAPDMVTELVDVAESHPAPGIVAPKILYYDQPERIWRLGDRWRRGWPVPCPLGRDAPDDTALDQVIAVDYVTGCGMLIRREVIERVGLFDARYFMYYEDADFCARARAAGYPIVVATRARMWHKVSASAKIALPDNLYARTKNRVRFFRAYPHGPLPALTLAYLLATSAGSTALRLVRGERQCAASLWHGFWDGCKDEPCAP